VAVYTHKDPTVWRRQLQGTRIHKVEQIVCHVLDRALVDALVEMLDRRLSLDLSVTDGTLFVNVGNTTLTGTTERVPLSV
jgi:uncharacterized protein YaeQ